MTLLVPQAPALRVLDLAPRVAARRGTRSMAQEGHQKASGKSRSWSSKRQRKTLQQPLHPNQSAKRITAAIAMMMPVEKTSPVEAKNLLVEARAKDETKELAVVPQLPEANMIAETARPMTVVATAVALVTGKTIVDITSAEMTLAIGAAMSAEVILVPGAAIHAVVPVVMIDVCSLVLAQLLHAGLRIITSTMVKVDAED